MFRAPRWEVVASPGDVTQEELQQYIRYSRMYNPRITGGARKAIVQEERYTGKQQWNAQKTHRVEKGDERRLNLQVARGKVGRLAMPADCR